MNAQIEKLIEEISTTGNGALLDLSTIERIDAPALHSLERLAEAADAHTTKVVLRGVNTDIYKVLKLMKLASRFSFVD